MTRRVHLVARRDGTNRSPAVDYRSTTDAVRLRVRTERGGSRRLSGSEVQTHAARVYVR